MKPEIAYVYNKLKQLRFDFKKTDFDDFRENYRYDPTLKRYVRKDDNDLYISKNTFKPLEEELEYADKCHNLEEQLGCPLEVVERALMNGIYTNVYNGLCIVSRFQDVLSVSDDYGVYIKDYKKTWWLKESKEE